jgi:cephalosporin hydroxylase
MDEIENFRARVARNIRNIGADADFLGMSNIWIRESIRHEYAQNFTWLGAGRSFRCRRDQYAIQELIWACRPDLVIETGVAHGGSLILSASLLAMLDYCDAVAAGAVLDPKASRRKVAGVDIDIRAHNRAAIEAHPACP